MEFNSVNMGAPPFGLMPESPGNSGNRSTSIPSISLPLSANELASASPVIGIDITFTCPGTDTIRRSFFRSEWNAVHLGREPAEVSGVANAFMRSDVVPPVMSRKHAEIMLASETVSGLDSLVHVEWVRAWCD
jgi:hypothetical protein